MLPDFIFLFYFPCSADHERDWPHRVKYNINTVVFLALVTNTLNVRNNNLLISLLY